MDQQPPAPQPPAPQPYQPYYNPPPPPPQKNSRVWLWVVLGVAGLCVVCGIVGAILFFVVGKNVTNIATQLATSLPSTMEAIVTTVPQATFEPAATEAPANTNASGYITDVIMAKGVQGDLLDPVDPTTTFSPNDVFHAVVKIQDAPDNTKFTATWFAENATGVQKNYKIDGNDITSGGSRNLDFNLTPNNGWPAGTYRVEISVDGNLEKTVRFTVK